MLYDPKWEKKSETKADPFSLESLIAWLEKQPADKVYCYLDNGRCLLGQYFTHHGYINVNAGSDDFAHGGDARRVPFPRVFDDIAHDSIASRDWTRRDDHTFGAALERARAALADRT